MEAPRHLPPSKVTTSGRTPVVGGKLATRFRHMLSRFNNLLRFHTGFGLPTLSRFELGYGSANRWKGGMWPSLTLLVVKGLADYGYLSEAQRIVGPLVNHVTAKSGGYWEFYDSQTGLPSHARNYIWAATVLPMSEFAGLLSHSY